MSAPDRYAVIAADPPWAYSDKRPGRGGCERYYRTMRPQDIRALPVESLALPDAVLFLWSTGPMLPQALSVMRAWGFDYRTLAFVWVKRGLDTESDRGKLAWGAGAYTRSNAELVLLGTRGAPRVASHSVHQIVEWPRAEHSVKPDEVYERIEKLCGDVPRIELFARRRRSGWASWGDQLEQVQPSQTATSPEEQQ